MRYYTQKPKGYRGRFSAIWIFIIILIILFLNLFMYLFDKRILPVVLNHAEIMMKSEAVRIINEESVKVYEEKFNYDDIIRIEKDRNGDISMIRSDTVKQNALASKVVLKCDDKLKKVGDLGIEVPIGYATNNVFFYQMGPKITVKMQQVGNISTSYESIFESAGINQTRHKIYLNVNVKIRVIVPLKSKDVDVVCQIPISETIIVGKIPDTAINLGN